MTEAGAVRTAIDGRPFWLALVVALAVAFQLATPASGDVAWLITANERAFDGRELYVGTLETNPPMAVWLYWLPALLEHLTGLSAEAFVVLETVAAGLSALWVTKHILGPIWQPSSAAAEPLCLAAVLLFPGNSFAEREHFILIGLLPGLALAALRYANVRPPPAWAILAAAAGDAFAVAIKPHFALVVLAVALLVALRRRSPRPLFSMEHWLTGVLLLAYVGLAALLYPAFFTRILPDAWALYVPERVGLAGLLIDPPLWTIYAIGLAAASLFRRQARRNPVPILSVATATCSIIFLLEGKGWDYQLLPATILAMLLLITVMLDDERGPISLPGSVLALGCLIGLPALAGSIAPVLRPDPLLPVLQRFGPGLRIGTISTDLNLANPLAREARDILVNSNPMMWYARGALGVTRNSRAVEIEQLARFAEQDRQLLLEDFERQPPDLILAEVPPSYDWLVWARRDPALDAILEQFQEVDRIRVGDGTIAVLRRGNQAAPK
jgi:hypothetical protein